MGVYLQYEKRGFSWLWLEKENVYPKKQKEKEEKPNGICIGCVSSVGCRRKETKYALRIVQVWIVAIILIFTISLGWYVSQPIVLGVSRSLESSIAPGQGRLVATGVEYVSYAWGPLLIIFILLWAIVSSSKKDIESEIYG